MLREFWAKADTMLEGSGIILRPLPEVIQRHGAVGWVVDDGLDLVSEGGADSRLAVQGADPGQPEYLAVYHDDVALLLDPVVGQDFGVVRGCPEVVPDLLRGLVNGVGCSIHNQALQKFRTFCNIPQNDESF